MGKGCWMFMDMWAASCRGEDAVSLPVHDRAVIVHEGGEEIARRFVKALAPEIPKMPAHPLPIEHRLRLQRRTFILSSSAVQSLKDRILSQSNGSHSPSTFTAISAHAWVSIAKTIASAAVDVTNLIFLADCRSRLNPPLPDSYAGNCVGPCYATAMWHALLGPQGLLLAQAEVARAVQERAKDPLRGCENWVEEFMGVAESGRVVVSGSPRFRVYETDFGWGELGRVELVSMNKDMEVVLVGGREPGSVQVSIVLDPGQMRLFAEVFLDGLEV
ncbi:uncharacterized protein A4U43_C03F17220 [Asparagus officinalis]|uniref:Uncharacterized protein n=1 Tax=Asparagus officinalis TaxID=4686 RepID=A0A5P1FBC3_ASPOF|nr:uncharacterized protein A4U43_C03F17220 [Asparagus officinalis]